LINETENKTMQMGPIYQETIRRQEWLEAGTKKK